MDWGEAMEVDQMYVNLHGAVGTLTPPRKWTDSSRELEVRSKKIQRSIPLPGAWIHTGLGGTGLLGCSHLRSYG